MTIEQAKQATKLLEEINRLLRYKNLLSTKMGHVAHFAFVQHYGNLDDCEKIDIDAKYNYLFTPILDSIIINLERELKLL
jgi:hypothetical protein